MKYYQLQTQLMTKEPENKTIDAKIHKYYHLYYSIQKRVGKIAQLKNWKP